MQLDILIDGKPLKHDGKPLKQVGDFIYLPWRGDIRNIKNSTKFDLYRVLVISIVTYGAETGTIKKSNKQRLREFVACLRRIL